MIQTYKKHLTFMAVLVAVMVAGVLGIGYVQDVRDSSVYALQVKQIKAAASIRKVEDFHKRVDKVRSFINKNSQHKEDEEFHSLWRDRTKVAETVIDYLEKRRTDLPHMESSTRAGLMAAILESEGYRVRSLATYNLNNETSELYGHAALEVYNRDTKSWETQDPQYDMYWKNRKTGKRASMLDAAWDKNVMPCNAKGCGWNIKSREGYSAATLKKYLAYVTSIDRKADERLTFHRPDIKPDAVVKYDGGEGTYCEVIGKNCKDGFFASSRENLEKVKD